MLADLNEMNEAITLCLSLINLQLRTTVLYYIYCASGIFHVKQMLELAHDQSVSSCEIISRFNSAESSFTELKKLIVVSFILKSLIERHLQER